MSDDVDVEDFVARPDKITGADINSICQEVLIPSVFSQHLLVGSVHEREPYLYRYKRDLFGLTA